MRNLLLITGAGASYDVVDTSKIQVHYNLRPPLTRDLFMTKSSIAGVTPCSVSCLNSHPQVMQVGYDFYNCLENGDAEVSLERYLLDLRKSKKITKRSRFWAVPLYLYDLIYQVSRGYLPTKDGLPSNYNSLIDAIGESEYDKILWLNLNYDLFADTVIKGLTRNRLDAFDDYMNLRTPDGLRIKYTKPHGSIDWFKGFINGEGLESMIKKGECPIDFEMRLGKEVCKAEVSNDLVIKNPGSWYPAITAPIGEYEFVYQKHIDDMAEDLRTTNSVLCVGFSALDKDILDLVKINLPQITQLMIVNGDTQTGRETFDRMTGYCPNFRVSKDLSTFNGGFTAFIKSGVKEWLKR